MRLGRRGWLLLWALLIAGFAAVAWWPRQDPFLWTYHADFKNSSPPVVGGDGTIYIGTRSGQLIAVRPDGTEKWIAKLGRGMVSEPVIGFNGNIHVSFAGVGDTGGVASVAPSGAINWSFRDGTSVWNSPAVARDGAVYFGSQNSNFFALNPDGTERWRFRAPSQIYCAPAVAPDGSVAFVSRNDTFHLLNPDGALVATSKLVNAYSPQPVTTPNTVASPPDGGWIVGIGSGIFALNSDGSQRWRTNLLDIPIQRTNKLYAPYLEGAPQFPSKSKMHLSAGNGCIYTMDADGKLLSVTDKGWRAIPTKAAAFSLTSNQGLLIAFENSFWIPNAEGWLTMGTENAAIVLVNANGQEEWRVNLPGGKFHPLRLLDRQNFKENRRLGFGVRAHQNLSRPVQGPDGAIYFLSNKSLHAIQPPRKE